MIKDDEFLLIYGWMLKLGMTHTELLVYAKIHNFCADRKHTFYGSIPYLMDWVDASRQSVINSLNKLVECGFILKRDRKTDGVVPKGESTVEYLLSDEWKKKISATDSDSDNNYTGTESIPVQKLDPYKNYSEGVQFLTPILYNNTFNSTVSSSPPREREENALNENISLAIDYVENRLGTSALNPQIYIELRDFAENTAPELITRAVDIAMAERKPYWSYIRGILRKWEIAGVRNIADALAREQQFQESKAKRNQPRNSKPKNTNKFAEMLLNESTNYSGNNPLGNEESGNVRIGDTQSGLPGANQLYLESGFGGDG
jgi:DnaD/phage-associated family protein